MLSQNLDVFRDFESEARSYCRTFPTVFDKAKSSFIYDESGDEYIDFFCAAGSLNFGHNNEKIKNSVLQYIKDDGILMTLDLHSKVKREFILTFQKSILYPRNLEYKLQFTSPTGTSVVESAIKLARKFTKRQNIIAFTNAYHGMTGISLGLTGSKYHRQMVSYGQITRFPYDGYLGPHVDSIAYYRKLLEDGSSGVDLPAAIILETVQGEGGLNVSTVQWLQDIRALATEFDILLIIDDIQAGCGRSGKFFSFERANIKPDMVCLSKSIGGIGFPFSLLLINPKLDIWSAGEDNGTFRGNNLAFVAATGMINQYWQNALFEDEIHLRELMIRKVTQRIAQQYSVYIKETRGLGLMQGIEFYSEKDAKEIIKLCFNNKLIIESCGPRDQVLKLMPALTIELDVLEKGLNILESVIKNYLSGKTHHTQHSDYEHKKASYSGEANL